MCIVSPTRRLSNTNNRTSTFLCNIFGRNYVRRRKRHYRHTNTHNFLSSRCRSRCRRLAGEPSHQCVTMQMSSSFFNVRRFVGKEGLSTSRHRPFKGETFLRGEPLARKTFPEWETRGEHDTSGSMSG